MRSLALNVAENMIRNLDEAYQFRKDISDKHYLVWSADIPPITAYLIIALKHESGTIEWYLAWSKDDKFPANLAPVMLPKDYHEMGLVASDPIDGRFMTMASYLWTNAETVAWPMNEKDKNVIVQDLTNKYREFVLPYLAGIA